MAWVSKPGRQDPAYERWLATHLAEAPPSSSGSAIKISVVMPVFNPDPQWLRAAVGSVRAQSHADWELCMADDASTEPGVLELLQAVAAEDPRIKWMRRTHNGHISAASNSALELATGAWVALLDQDDLLAPHALAWMAHEIGAHPEARVVYSDEDKVDAHGRHFAPHLKADWNPELLRSQNFVSHLGVYETARLRAQGGFRVGFEGAQDHDLVLRMSEGLSDGQVRHVARVLYHWRAHAGSTAGIEAGGAKAYAEDAGRRAVQDHLDRLGRSDLVLATPDGLRCVPRFFAEPPFVSIIVTGWRDAAALQATARAVVQGTAYPRFEMLLLDLSDGGAAQACLDGWISHPGLRAVPRLPGDTPVAAARRATALAEGTMLAWVGDGVVPVRPDWLDELVGRLLPMEVGAAGGQVVDGQGVVVDGALLLDPMRVALPAFAGSSDGGYFNRACLAQNLSAVSAAFAVVKRSAYEEAGGFGDNPASLSLAFVDLCLRLGKVGRRIVWSPYAEGFQTRAAPSPAGESAEDLDLMTHRWHAALRRDPVHNPHLVRGAWALDVRRAKAGEGAA